MCKNISLEICCAEEPTQCIPYTLRLLPVISLCAAASAAHTSFSSPYPYPLPAHAFALQCHSYNPSSVRCERIFWTSCALCVRRRAEAQKRRSSSNSGDAKKEQEDEVEDEDEEINEQDLGLIFEYNRLLLVELIKALGARPYADVVRAMPGEFGIGERFVLRGARWMDAAAEEGEDEPHPDTSLEGLKWWLDQGLGEVSDEIWAEFCASYCNNLAQQPAAAAQQLGDESSDSDEGGTLSPVSMEDSWDESDLFP
ncbi:hypothetical protein AAE478_004983 [Parahypoxylon ruwenzoriense]